MKPLSPKNRDWQQVLLLASGICLVLAASFLAFTKFQELRQVRQQVATETQLLQRHKEVARSLQNLEENLTRLREEAGQLAARIPANENLPSLLAELIKKAEESRVEIVKLNLSPPAPASSDGKQTELELYLHGTYPNIKRYLGSLQAAERFLAIKSLEITQPQNRTAGVMEGRLIISAYYLPEPGTETKVAVPEVSGPLGRLDPFPK